MAEKNEDMRAATPAQAGSPQGRVGGKGTGKITAGKGSGRVTPGRGSGRAPAAAGKGSGKVTAGHGMGARKQRAAGGKAGAGAAKPVAAEAPEKKAAPAVADEPLKAAAPEGQAAAVAEGPAEGAAPAEQTPHMRMRWGVGSTRVRDRSRLSEKMSKSTRLRLWLQSSALDFVMVLVVCVALVHTVAYAFNSADRFQGNFLLIAGLCIPLLLAMFAGSWSKRALLPSIGATVALMAIYVGVSMAISPEEMFVAGAVNDSPDNYTVFTMVLCVTTILVYLLSRRTVGLVFLLVGCVVACGFVQYAWPEWLTQLDGLPSFLVTFLGVVMLFVYQCYKQSVYSANRAKRTSFAGAFAYSALVGVICVVVGVGVFAAIQSIAPDTVQIKPFEEHVSPPVDEKANSYERSEVEGDDTTNETDDHKEDADDADGGNDIARNGFGFLQGTLIGNVAQSLAGFDPNDPNQDFQNIAYLIMRWELLIMGILVALLILAAVLIQRARRKLRLRRIEKESPGYQAWYLYTFLVERFRRLKLAKPAHLTPLEFAVGFSKPMLPFTRGTDGVDFVDVSGTYQDAVFGGEQPSEEELDDMKAYYRAFFKNARQYVGLPKWCLWKFWRV